MYEYNCKIVKIIDGDTVDVDIDLGFGIWIHNERIRVIGIDAPETRTSDPVEKIFGMASKQRLEQLLVVGSTTVLRTTIDKSGTDAKGKFGRILGDFVLGDRTVTEILVEEGHAVKYHGQTRADIDIAHLANQNRLMSEGVVDPALVQAAQKK